MSSVFKKSSSNSRTCMKRSPSFGQKIDLKQELARERFNRPVHVFEAIVKFAQKDTLRLSVPETLFKLADELIYVYTDAEGLVRVRKDQAKEAFSHHCKMMRQKAKMGNPSAIAYPKYVAFSEIGVQCTLKHKRDLEPALTSVYMVQRFIPPPSSVVFKTILHWYRTKVTTKHLLISRIDLKNRLLVSTGTFLVNKALRKSPALDLPFIVSLQHMDTLEIEKGKRVTEEDTCMLDTVREVLVQEELSPDEQLEEMVLSYITSLDGKLYCLKSSRVFVVPSTIRLHMHDLPRELMSIRRTSVPLPLEIVPHPIPEPNSPYRPKPTKTLARAALSQDHLAIANEHVSHLLSSMDHMRSQAQDFKLHSRKIKFEAYGTEFLHSCMHNIYGRALHDPRLARYFSQAHRDLESMAGGMLQVFTQGRYPARIKEIHSKLHIAECDFVLFLKIVEKALKDEGASDEDVQYAISYMNTFKGAVVTSHRVSLFELIHHQ